MTAGQTPGQGVPPDVHRCLRCGGLCSWTGDAWTHDTRPVDGHQAVAGGPCLTRDGQAPAGTGAAA